MRRPPSARPWRHGAAGVIVHFRLTPKSSKDGVNGVVRTADGPAFQAHVRAPPEDGAANAALLRLVATWLGLSIRDVELATGARSRLKSLSVRGDAEAICRLLEAKARSFVSET